MTATAPASTLFLACDDSMIFFLMAQVTNVDSVASINVQDEALYRILCFS